LFERNANGQLRSTDDVLLDVADKFASYEDGAAKAALAQEVFGNARRVVLSLPLLQLQSS
jgi:hypothetical protein